MPNLVARLANSLALVTVAGALSSGTLEAQGDVKVSAWISSRPITAAGADSGKVVLAVKISGMTEVALRSLKPDQIALRSESGRVYSPFGSPSPIPPAASANVVAHFYRAEASSAGQYFFLVRPGGFRYELWLPGRRPLSFAASLVRSAAR